MDAEELGHVLGQALAQSFKDGYVPVELAAAIVTLLPNVSWLKLSIPYEFESERYMVSVGNLTREGLTSCTCLAAEETAAALCVRNAVPCISSGPDFEDVADAFEQQQCGIVLSIPIGRRPSQAMTSSGVRSLSGPGIAALLLGYVAGENITEQDLLAASTLAAQMSPFVAVLAQTFVPDLMRACACTVEQQPHFNGRCWNGKDAPDDDQEPPSGAALQWHHSRNEGNGSANDSPKDAQAGIGQAPDRPMSPKVSASSHEDSMPCVEQQTQQQLAIPVDQMGAFNTLMSYLVLDDMPRQLPRRSQATGHVNPQLKLRLHPTWTRVWLATQRAQQLHRQVPRQLVQYVAAVQRAKAAVQQNKAVARQQPGQPPSASQVVDPWLPEGVGVGFKAGPQATVDLRSCLMAALATDSMEDEDMASMSLSQSDTDGQSDASSSLEACRMEVVLPGMGGGLVL